MEHAPGEAPGEAPGDAAGAVALPPASTPGPATGAAQRRDRRVWIGIVALSLLAYGPSLAGLCFGAWPFANDGTALFAPWRTFARHALWHGTLPLWNPHSFCGLPFMSNVQTATLYPVNLVYWVFPLAPAFVLDAFIHQLILAFGLYALARALHLSRTSAWLAMAAFSLGGAVSGHMYAGQMSWHAARAYLPYELWAVLLFLRTGRRNYAVSFAGLLTLQIFAGYPPLVLLSTGLCCGLLLARTVTHGLASRPNPGGFRLGLPAGWTGTVIKVAAVVACLVAVSILPMQDQSRLSVHGSGLPYKDAVELSGTWRSLLRLLIPDFFGGNWLVQWSVKYDAGEEAAYLGILVFVLALGAPWFARRHGAAAPGGAKPSCLPPGVPWLWSLLLVSWVLAMGDNTPLYHWLFRHLVLFRLTRFPMRWLEVWYLCGALLAGFSFDQLLRAKPAAADAGAVGAVGATGASGASAVGTRRTRCLQWLLLALAVPCFLLSWWMSTIPASDALWVHKAQWNLVVSGNSLHRGIAEYLRATAITQPVIAGIIATACGFALVAWHRTNAPRQSRVAKLLVAVAMLDVLVVFWRYMAPLPEQSLQEYVWWPPALTRRHEPDQRWDSQVHWYALNQNVPLGLDQFNGYDALSGRRFFDFVDYLEGRKFWHDAYVPQFRPPLLRVAAVTHTLTWAKTPTVRRGDPPLTVVAQQGLWKLWRHDGAWPRVYLSRHVLRAAEPDQLRLLDRLARQSFAGAGQPVVAGPDKFAMLAPVPLTAADVVLPGSRGLNTVSLQVAAAQPSVLVQTETLCPGWRAWVNGSPASLEYANYLFRAVRVPAGASRTTLVYEPQTYRFSLFVSLCGLALCAGAAMSRLGRPAPQTL